MKATSRSGRSKSRTSPAASVRSASSTARRTSRVRNSPAPVSENDEGEAMRVRRRGAVESSSSAKSSSRSVSKARRYAQRIDDSNSSGTSSAEERKTIVFPGRMVEDRSETQNTEAGPLHVRTLVVVRVYKRWIFASVVATLLFSFLVFPLWFETAVLPGRVAEVRDALLDTALFRAIADAGGAQRATAEALLGNFAELVRPVWANVREAAAFGRGAEDAALRSEASALGAAMRARGAVVRHPVVMLPGITSTCLELWEGRPCASRLFRQRIWGSLTMMRVMLTDSACWREHLRLGPDGLDPEGVRVRASQGLEAADFLLPGFWVWARLIEALAAVGYDHSTMVMAAYDWRVDVAALEARDRFFSRLRTTIEHHVATAGGTRVVVLAHSLGGIVFHHFMHWAESRCAGWVGRHVHAFVPIGVGFLGAPKAVAAVLSGESRDTAHMGALETHLLEMLMSRAERLSLFRTWPGAFGMAPKGGALFWGDGVRPAPDQPAATTHPHALVAIDGVSSLARTAARETLSGTRGVLGCDSSGLCACDPSSSAGSVDPMGESERSSRAVASGHSGLDRQAAAEHNAAAKAGRNAEGGNENSPANARPPDDQQPCVAGEHAEGQEERAAEMVARVTRRSPQLLKAVLTGDDIDRVVLGYTPAGIASRIDRVYGGVSAPARMSHTAAQAAAARGDPAAWSNALAVPLPDAPDMAVYCMYGVGKATERAYRYRMARPDDELRLFRAAMAADASGHSGASPLADAELADYVQRGASDDAAKMHLRVHIDTDAGDEGAGLRRGVYLGDGDGSVPFLSSGYMCAHGWRAVRHLNPAGVAVVSREYMHDPDAAALRGGPRTADHVDILGNHELTMDILRIVTDTPPSDAEAEDADGSSGGAARRRLPLSDRFYTPIREVSARIAFPQPGQ